MKHLGDITLMNGAEIEPVDIISGGSPCLTADSLILTKDGYKEIGSIKVGEEVLTKSREWHKVAKKFDNGVHPTCVIDALGTENIHCTLNHKFWVRRMTKHTPVGENGKRYRTREFSSPEFKEAKDLDRKDYLGMPVIKDEIPFYSDNLHFWYLVGYYLGDGWLPLNDKRICFAVTDEKMKRLFPHISDKSFSIHRMETCNRMYMSYPNLRAFLENHIGTGCENKTIPACVLNLPIAELSALYQGYLDSDGCKIDEEVRQFTTVNRGLAYGMAAIIIKLFHQPVRIYKIKVSPTKVICGRTVNQKDWYQLRFKVNGKKQDKAFYQDGYVWYPFNKRTDAEEEFVYNMEVEEDHSYILQNCISKNCQDLSVAGLRKGLTTEDGELTRSGLYMEQMRIVREMRKATGGLKPRFSVWENVPGALSSGKSVKGSDFAAVLEEVIKVKYPFIPPIEVPKDGWPNAGVIHIGDMSLAYRIHDAQYWGVPQRRRRICVLADFNGLSAPYLVFGPKHKNADFVTPKGKKRGAIALRLSTNLMGGDEWVEDTDFPIYNYNITELPDGGQAKLWGVETGECTDTDSLLSNILETGEVPLRYYLSAKACRGILSRAERRGKVLPEELRLALEEQIVWMEQLNGESDGSEEPEEDSAVEEED